MIDRLFLAALTFCLLAAGTTAIGSALLGPAQESAVQLPVATKRLPTVEVVGTTARAESRLAQADAQASATLQ
jgi:hypothetical protein